MNQVYVVWEMVPESTRIYYLILSDEELERAQRCHGHFVNLANTPPDVEKDLQWLNEYLGEQRDSLVYNSEAKNPSPIEIFAVGHLLSGNLAATLIISGWVG